MVGEVVRDIRRHAPDFDVVVIDDGSTDGTVAEARGRGRAVVSHPFNLGIGGAMQSGFQYALRHGYDVAVQVDGDGQHEPAYLPELLERLHRAATRSTWSPARRFRERPRLQGPGRPPARDPDLLGVLSLIIRQRITDPTSGFRMTNRRGIELFARDYPHDYPEVEAILMLHAHRLRIEEVPVRMSARGFGRSSIDARAAPTTWSRSCSAIFVGLFRRRPIRSTIRSRRRASRRVTRGDRAALSGARDAPRRRGQHRTASRSSRSSRRSLSSCSSSSSCAAGGWSSATRCCGCRAAVVLLGLAVWRTCSRSSPTALGIALAVDALFLVAFGFVLVLLLHFSLVISRLSTRPRSSPRSSRGSTTSYVPPGSRA